MKIIIKCYDKNNEEAEKKNDENNDANRDKNKSDKEIACSV